MAATAIRAFSLIILASMIISLVIGIAILATKVFSDKKKKILGSVLIAMSIINLFFFNIMIFRHFVYKIGEFIVLILIFVVPFIEGMVLLAAKEIKPKTKRPLGIILILLPVIWLVIAFLGV